MARKPVKQDSQEIDERLTNRHIKTLTFLQDLVKENRQLKDQISSMVAEKDAIEAAQKNKEALVDRIKQIKMEYTERLDDARQRMAVQHEREICKVIEEKVNMERVYLTERRELLEKIEVLEKLLKDSNVERDRFSQPDDILQSKIKNLEVDIATLRSENSALKRSIQASKYSDASKREAQNALNSTIKEHEAMNESLRAKVDSLSLQLDASSKQYEELKNQKSKETADLTATNVELQKKLNETHSALGSLSTENEQLYDEIEKLKMVVGSFNTKVNRATSTECMDCKKLHEERRALLQQIESLKGEVAHLQRQLSIFSSAESTSFRAFVDLKKDFSKCRDENDKLKDILKANASSIRFDLPQS